MAKPISLQIAREYIGPLKKAGIDTLILGCTHYPLLKGIIQKAAGKNTVLVDSAREVAHEVKELLARLALIRTGQHKPFHKFFVSDRPQEFKRIARNFLGRELTHIAKV